MKTSPRIKVAYVCHYSSPYLQNRINLKLGFVDILMLYLSRKPISTSKNQFAVWNENAIAEMKKYREEVDFHVIAPYSFMKNDIEEWTECGITYHFFRDKSHFISFIHRHIFKLMYPKHKHNRNIIQGIIRSIQPDIVHVVGAENPYYSLCALDIPQNIPLLVQLQTLMSEPGFENKYPISHDQYVYRTKIEKDIILRADYIGTRSQYFRNIITDTIKPNAKFLDITLALAEKIVENRTNRTQDFIYFSKDISKAADWAIEAFALAYRIHPEINLTIVGGYSPLYKSKLDERINQLGITDAVRFTGALPTHEDVLHEVRKSKYALLPIKADLITGTIREAMASSVPVISNITPGTPKLNNNRLSILLSEAGNYEAMSVNMCKLIENAQLYSEIQRNAIATVSEKYNNENAIEHWVECYKQIISNVTY